MTDSEWRHTQSLVSMARLDRSAEILAYQCLYLFNGTNDQLEQRLGQWILPGTVSKKARGQRFSIDSLNPELRMNSTDFIDSQQELMSRSNTLSALTNLLDGYLGYKKEPRQIPAATFALVSYCAFKLFERLLGRRFNVSS